MNGLVAVVGSDGRMELRIGANSEALRERLGLTAWVALEALVLESTSVGDGVVVATSARHLAGRLGIGKDRAADALRVLRDAGLATCLTTRAEHSARFVAHRYAIAVPVSRAPAGVGKAAPGERITSARDVRLSENDRLFDLDRDRAGIAASGSGLADRKRDDEGRDSR